MHPSFVSAGYGTEWVGLGTRACVWVSRSEGATHDTTRTRTDILMCVGGRTALGVREGWCPSRGWGRGGVRPGGVGLGVMEGWCPSRESRPGGDGGVASVPGTTGPTPLGPCRGGIVYRGGCAEDVVLLLRDRSCDGTLDDGPDLVTPSPTHPFWNMGT